MSKNNGGPAFPEIRIKQGDNYNAPAKIYYGGMTLRDYFAAKAMHASMTADPAEAAHEIAARAYAVADAMLKARNT